MRPSKRAKSECGRYFAERVEGESWHRLYDQSGKFLGTASYWSNRSTATRIAFETGFDDVRAVFSRPRYPRNFRRRWVICFDIWIDELAEIAKSCRCLVVTAWKPNINVWSHIGLMATAEQIKRFDQILEERKAEFNRPPCRGGQWDIEFSQEGLERAIEESKQAAGGA